MRFSNASLTMRFTAAFATMSFLFLSAFSVFVYEQSKKKSYLFAESSLTTFLEHEWQHLDLPSHQMRKEPGTPHFKDLYLRIWKSGNLLYDSFPKEYSMENSRTDDEDLYQTVHKTHNGHDYELQGIYDLSPIRGSLAALRNTLIACSLGSLLLILPLAYLFTRALLKPFRNLAAETSMLNAHRLTYRFENPKALDEYGMLTRNINLLLERLERSFSQVGRFAMHASHEIRTPLSVIISQSELALRKERTNEEYRESIQKTLQPAMRLRNIVNRLLCLAELDQIKQQGTVSELSAKSSIENIVQTLKQAHGNKLVSYSNSAEIIYRGNREVFDVVVGNLVENAFKYARQSIKICLNKSRAGIQVVVEDDGKGLTPEEIQLLTSASFGRHHTDSREVPVQGSGLGYSIVQSCLAAVNGKLEVGASRLGGLSVSVEFPQAGI